MEAGNENKSNKDVMALVEKLKTELGNNLISVSTFGFPNHGNKVRVLVLVDQLSLDDLRKMAAHRNEKKFLISLLTREELANSQDVFPLYFLDAKQGANILYGENPFSRVAVDKSKLRNALEHELRLAVIQFRHGFMNAQGAVDQSALLGNALAALTPAFCGLLYLKGLSATDLVNALSQVEHAYGLQASISSSLSGNQPIADRLATFYSFLLELVEKADKL